jgi:uncharacterized protein YjbI with pentapeptide repeats
MFSISEAKTTPDATFVCECEDDVRSACTGEVFYNKYGGKQYCVFHSPSTEKEAAFSKALKKKIDAKDFNFRGLWFPEEAKFSRAIFHAKVDFFKATFNAIANFSSVSFEEANFRNAIFNGEAYFDHTVFDAPAVFRQARFKEKADFYQATFNRGAPVYFDYASFCSVADFRETTFNSLADFANAKLKLAHFNKASFNAQSDFSNAIFAEEAYFPRTTFIKESEFKSAKFEAESNFSFATFETADFRNAIFLRKADFNHATFGIDAGFSYTKFGAEAVFSSTSFRTQAYFSLVTFSSKVDFSYALFEDYIKFAGAKKEQVIDSELSLDFQHARIDKPDHVSFLSLTLRPNWFVNVDVRKLDFTDVNWDGSISQEIKELKKKEVSSPHLLLAVVYRQLAVNAEDNHRYEEASRFRYWAMELLREVRWRDFEFWDAFRKKLSSRLQLFSQHRFVTPLKRDWLSWLYWAASGYGERIRRAFLGLLGIWVLFAYFYTQVGFTPENAKQTSESTGITQIDEVGKPLRFTPALTYSLGVMSLQKPEPHPLTGTAHILVTIETIFGPLQAALLALAIRRKFMR